MHRCPNFLTSTFILKKFSVGGCHLIRSTPSYYHHHIPYITAALISITFKRACWKWELNQQLNDSSCWWSKRNLKGDQNQIWLAQIQIWLAQMQSLKICSRISTRLSHRGQIKGHWTSFEWSLDRIGTILLKILHKRWACIGIIFSFHSFSRSLYNFHDLSCLGPLDFPDYL